jgi:hypothetical protein
MREDEEKGDDRSYTWQIDQVTGEPFLVAGPRTPQQIEDDKVIDAIWQKLEDDPSLDPEMHAMMFGRKKN